MEQVAIMVPYDFIASRVRLTWREAAFGMEEGLLSPPDAIALASDILAAGHDSSSVLELASSSRDEPVMELVRSLADAEGEQDVVEMRRLWAFLVLAWIFEHRGDHQDPLDLAEKVYADLDYPEQVAPIIRYMPSDEPDLGTPALNEARLLGTWRDYLQAESQYFQSRARSQIAGPG